MSAFEQMLASIGIGAAKLSLAVDGDSHPRGSVVTGSVTLKGGLGDQRVYKLTISLIELWGTGKNCGANTIDRRIVASDLIVKRGSTQVYEFSFLIQDDATLTRSATSMGTIVKAEAHIALLIPPRARTRLNVVPHREISAVFSAMNLLGFTVAATGDIDFTTTVVMNFRAPAPLRDHLDGASLQLRPLGHNIVGRLVLKRHQHTLAEHLSALVDASRELYPLSIPRSELLVADDPVPEAAVPYLRAILQDALVPPGQANKTLLRPAEPPPTDSLLRPASGTSEHDSRLLLRPESGKNP